MTMDIQKYNNYDDSSPDLKPESSRSEQFQSSRQEMQFTPSGQVGKAIKRSFDVAFLMLPDDKLRQKQTERQLRVSKQIFANQEWEATAPRKAFEQAKPTDFTHDHSLDPRDESDRSSFDDRTSLNNNPSPTFGQELNIDVGTDEYPQKHVFSDSDASERSGSRPNSNDSAVRLPRFLPESPYKNKVFDDPTLIMQSRARFEQMSRYGADKSPDSVPRSAFTKVTAAPPVAAASPDPSVSPDNLLYQNSISPPLSASSPPTTAFTKAAYKSILSPNHPLLSAAHPFFKAHHLQACSPNYSEGNQVNLSNGNALNGVYGKFHASDFHQEKTSEVNKQASMPPSAKFPGLLPFRPEIPPYLQAGSPYPFSVQNFQAPGGDLMKFPVREPAMSPLMGSPAAALLSTLLPPTLAAFSLPAQNVCAKCNISFRMTSDLVYHMRTHHKSEVANDPGRRKREEKLKCPVCSESFRERHHLTRHMTAHQDKAGDLEDAVEGRGGSGQTFTKNKNKTFFSHNASTLHHK